MADEDFDARLDQMKRVLEVVATIEGNTDLQNAAFSHMFGKSTLHVRTPQIHVEASGDADANASDSTVGDIAGGAGGGNGKPKPKRTTKAAKVSIDQTLETAPEGVQSWRDFIAEKKPATQNDKNTCAVYWIKEVAKLPKANANQVVTLYVDAGWTAPSNPKNSLSITATRAGFLDTSDGDDIKVSPRGYGLVRNDLPSKSAK
ncbi:hypothetical protein DY023_03395 [Microbacterium bovistercoris]|uniref:Uncharacterized protein n=1 Tax=Microbacterium bovistercoris TaxID=2293570 RepID=A0A371NY96_9MICO|nr:hypothetical protein [Microbacterium bovistercoris]REJ07688.1 hypothetical protein DY023_03395 [Microbacterium bovistercoris]